MREVQRGMWTVSIVRILEMSASQRFLMKKKQKIYALVLWQFQFLVLVRFSDVGRFSKGPLGEVPL